MYYSIDVSRKPFLPDQVSGNVITIRLTSGERQKLDTLVTIANRMLRASGLPEAVSASALVRTLIDRAAAEAGLNQDSTDPAAMPWSAPIDLQTSHVSPKGTTGSSRIRTRYERIMDSFEQESKSKGKGDE